MWKLTLGSRESNGDWVVVCTTTGNWPIRNRRVTTLLLGLGLACGWLSVAVGQQFEEVSGQSGMIGFITRSWGSPIWGDMNNDGFLDLIVPTHELALSGGPFVYLNNGDGTFTDIRGTSGIEKGPSGFDTGDWLGFAFGDYDGDGNLDLYIAEDAYGNGGRKAKRDLLFRGYGDGTFTNVSISAGIESSDQFGTCAFWVDYDNDGKLDLFVKNFTGNQRDGPANRLYKNNGDGTFTQVADAGGLIHATNGLNLGTVCSFADYDNDGFMDVAFTGPIGTDELYRNQGDGTFVNVTTAAGLKPLDDGAGIAWGDCDNDGFLDLYIARGCSDTCGDGLLADTLYHNNGDGTFTDVTAAAGITDTANTWAAIWGDYDNDGFLDLFVSCAGATTTLGPGNANILYHNNGDGTFTNVAAHERLTLQDDVSLHDGAAWADYNNDGFLDLILKDGIGPRRLTREGAFGYHRLFRNTGNRNHFIKVKLIGVQSNRDGIGARVLVTYSGGIGFRQNNGGGGGDFESQGNEPLHFGIGTARTVTVKVQWPSGIADMVRSTAIDSTLTIVEGTAP